MKFVHVSDTHLGASNFKLSERKQDFYNAFKQVIDFCLRNKPDFVIHTGDLFDTGKPDNETILFAIDELKRLKKEGIPLFIIPGSHDMSVDGTYLTILERVELLTNLANPRYYEINENEIIVKGEVVKDAFICGLPGRRANIKDMYELAKVNKPKDKFGIFMFHHIVSDIKGTEIFSDISKTLLPKGMDYYAGGHWHEKEELAFDQKPIIYPGSTEYHNIDAMEKGNEKGFFFYDNGNLKFVKIKTRPVKVIKVNCNGLSPEQVVEKCKSLVEESNNGIIILKLHGELKAGLKGEINKESIRNAFKGAGWLYCEIRTKDLKDPGKSIVSHKKTLDEIEYEYLKKQGYNEREIELARTFINLLGESLAKNELKKAVMEAFALL